MDKWISIAAITMVTTVAACTASQQNAEVRPVLSFDGKAIADNGTTEYEKGKKLLSQGRFAAAAQAFQAALFTDGSSIEVLNALAISYDKLGRYDLSDRYYQRALALNSKDPQTVNNLAVSLAQRGAPDLAAKVLANVQAQRPSDKTIAANLRLAQEQATRQPAPVAAAPLPAPTVPAVPRIEQTSPSTQELVTIGAKHPDAISFQPSTTSVATSHVAAVAPEANADTVQAETADAPSVRPKIVTEALTAPQKAISSESGGPAKLAVATPLPAGSVPVANGHQTTDKLADVGSRKADFGGAPALSESALTALAHSRLGSRIAESDNIQPADFAVPKSNATEVALERLGVRVEVANGTGRRYMAARMRTFLGGQGFDVARVTNARSFDHVQTVIIYRDQFRPEALELAKTLTSKVELLHMADLPVDIRVILGRDLLPFDRTLEKGG